MIGYIFYQRSLIQRKMKKVDGSKPKDFKTKDGSIGARFEILFHVKCTNCRQMWAKGVRFDSRKFTGKFKIELNKDIYIY